MNKHVNLVCAATYDAQTGDRKKWWLHNSPKTQKELEQYLIKFNLIIGYSTIAEARSYLSMGMNPRDFQWIDLFLEYRCLTNNNDELMYGRQLVDGKVKTVQKPKPKWERSKEDKKTGFKPSHSLAEATFKILDIVRDTEHKDKMRELIISDPVKFSPEERTAILDYCLEDVDLLPDMWAKMKLHYFELDPQLTEAQLIEEAKVRGRFAINTAIMETEGYPYDEEATKRFAESVPMIIRKCQIEINSFFPDINPFRWNRPEGKFSWNQKITKEWIVANHDIARWEKTDKKDISLSLDAFQRFYDFKHDYPTDNFGAQMVRYLKLLQSLYGFRTSKESGRKTFWDSVGPDGRVRPYTNIYGAQSSRSQPSSTGFLFLKPAWMRALCKPKPGKFMAEIDWGSQEFFISALKSRDQNMIDAYLSGDVYLAFGKQAGRIPQEATKESHKNERDTFKATLLAISYLMTCIGLAIDLTQKTGRVWTEDEAQDLIDLFDETYPDFKEYREWTLEIYREDGHIRLDDGWYMWGDNDNFRSVANMPIQGFGGCVLRKAVDLAYDKGLNISFTLHDAITIEGNIGEEYKIIELRECMREAFTYYFEDDLKETAAKIKMDAYAWSPDYPEEGELEFEDGYKVPCSNIYLDDRAKRDLDTFGKYFRFESGADLL
jgi:hypothetical protein